MNVLNAFLYLCITFHAAEAYKGKKVYMCPIPKGPFIMSV